MNLFLSEPDPISSLSYVFLVCVNKNKNKNYEWNRGYIIWSQNTIWELQIFFPLIILHPFKVLRMDHLFSTMIRANTVSVLLMRKLPLQRHVCHGPRHCILIALSNTLLLCEFRETFAQTEDCHCPFIYRRPDIGHYSTYIRSNNK